MKNEEKLNRLIILYREIVKKKSENLLKKFEVL